jgi:hypothetical protein
MDLVAGALKEYFNAAPVAHVYRKPVSERRDVMPVLGAFCTTGLFAGLIEYAGSMVNDGGRGKTEGGANVGVSDGVQKILDEFPVGTSDNPKIQETSDNWDDILEPIWANGGQAWFQKTTRDVYEPVRILIHDMKRDDPSLTVSAMREFLRQRKKKKRGSMTTKLIFVYMLLIRT